MRRTTTIAAALLALVFGSALDALAGERFVLRASAASVKEICRAHGLKRIRSLGRSDLHLVAGPRGLSRDDLQARLAQNGDLNDVELEQDERVRFPKTRSVATPDAAIPAFVDNVDRTPMDFYGQSAWAGYVYQQATELIGIEWARDSEHTGAGVIVAVIDTGADPEHPLLEGRLVGAYDFTRDLPGSSEWADLDQSTTAFVDQSTTAFVDQSTTAFVDQSTTAFVDQSTTAFVDQSTTAFVDSEHSAFGHGTMVAGLVHLVAPEAQIMPLKAFGADGSALSSDIVRAIYYAVDHGAKVINMSFHAGRSRQVRRAIRYATQHGVICVGSAGNDGEDTLVFPAGLRQVLGVAATTFADERAPFSNYGEKLVTVAAPGVHVITIFPGGRHAAVSGTSFSAALVAGAAGLLAELHPRMTTKVAFEAFEASQFISEDLGFGRIDLPSAVARLQSTLPYQPRGKGKRHRRW